MLIIKASMLAHTPDPLAGASGDCHAEDQCGRADRNLVNRTFTYAPVRKGCHTDRDGYCHEPSDNDGDEKGHGGGVKDHHILSLGHFQVGSYRYRSLIEGLCTL